MKNIFLTSLLLITALIIISAGKTFHTKPVPAWLDKRHDIINCGSQLTDITADANGNL